MLSVLTQEKIKRKAEKVGERCVEVLEKNGNRVEDTSLAAFILVGVVAPVQKFYSDKLKSTLDQSVDSGLEPLLREVPAIDSGF